ncbi:hypothetical protein Rumeso_01211 [Rubellimicrobium mesophilum DSM 19309]|uniref:Uncharacterized protein n=1 Tax=Rubellimicrobium mesophilum DSM 19309 TaxID=442562 RepID=A0A017HU34_9RHOB|nr:hypothetical protein [Rubellimicrobium mesophilum]EYD77264.1 hypothetical protein Rumeso_01211 [Rubellimicrobium mesophilum DSM 19309]
MQAIMSTTKGLAVLFGTQMDRIAGLAIVAAALVLGAWLCSLGLQ